MHSVSLVEKILTERYEREGGLAVPMIKDTKARNKATQGISSNTNRRPCIDTTCNISKPDAKVLTDIVWSPGWIIGRTSACDKSNKNSFRSA